MEAKLLVHPQSQQILAPSAQAKCPELLCLLRVRTIRPAKFMRQTIMTKYKNEKVSSENTVLRTDNASAQSDRPDEKSGDSPVRFLRQLLGDRSVLIPVKRGQKKPLEDGWSKLTVECMEDPDHLAKLNARNIGVVLGSASAGLCAVDIDNDAEVEPFLELNPLFRTTLRTRGARGAQFWIKVQDGYPKLVKLNTNDGADWGEWRADGGQSVIHGIHPDTQKPYTIQHKAKPIEVRFEDIRWPDTLKLPWIKSAADLLAEKYGEACQIRGGGSIKINDYYFVARFQQEHRVLWEPLQKTFYRYIAGNGLWEVATEDKIKLQFGEDIQRASDEIGTKGLLWERKNGQLSALAATLRGMVEKQGAFNKSSPVIHLTNGMLDLRSNPAKLLSFHPDHYSRNICPLKFDPEAQCPRFIKELLYSALNEEDVGLLQRWAGTVLLGINSAQRILLLTGTAGGGKSTLIEIIEKVIGERNVAQIRTKHLEGKFELYRFIGKTLLTGKDVGAEFLSEDGAEMLKALVGNDLLDAEKKNGNEQFQLRGNFNVAITCNSKLRVKLEGDAGAWQRRLMIIDYTKPKPTERITQFADKLIAAEGAGILNWMIEGAIQYLQEEEEHGDFWLTEEQQRRVTDLLAESDSVRQFVKDRVVPCDGSDVTVGELESAYQEYCEDCGWRAVASREFRTTINVLMLEIHHAGRRNDIPRGLDNRQQRGFKNITTLGGGL